MRAEELLAALLSAYELHDAPRVGGQDVTDRMRRGALAGLPEDPAERLDAYQRELVEALPVLEQVSAMLAKLRGPVLLKPAAYREAWRHAIELWNAALYEHGWLTLPPLCDVCGVPVLLRGVERQGDRVELSTVCSERCRNARKVARHRAK
ncbi:MAG: hypothetical protein KDC14_00230 [Planctomycetes bacterium]|nr:hypothetical protein [Planctomycetota bacterium]